MRPQASYLTSPSLSLLICKMGRASELARALQSWALWQIVFSKNTMAIPSHISFYNTMLTFPYPEAGCTFLPLDHHHVVGVTVCGLRLGHKRSCSFLLGFLGCSLWRKAVARPTGLPGSPVEGPGPCGEELKPAANNQCYPASHVHEPPWTWILQAPSNLQRWEAPATDFNLMRYPKPEVLTWATPEFLPHRNGERS